MVDTKDFFRAFLDEIALTVKKEVTDAVAQLKTSSEEDVILTKRDVAEYFQVTQRTVDNWIDAGWLKAYRIGNQVRFKRKEFRMQLEKCQLRGSMKVVDLNTVNVAIKKGGYPPFIDLNVKPNLFDHANQ